MATYNPVSAFLQGFQVVDNLETNRQNRAFRDEQQSQLRKVWQRGDDEYARQEKARMQGEFRDLYSNIHRGVILNAPEGEEGAAFLGNANKVQNEVLKQMIQARPDFGEALALSMGLDAADGPLISDRTRPVTGAGIDPGGRGVAVTVNSVNGPDVPATVNRTAADNDPVWFGQPTTATMVDLMGPEFMTSDAQEFQMFRKLMESEGQSGDPFSEVRAAGESKRSGMTRDEQIAYDAESEAIDSAAAGGTGGTAKTAGDQSAADTADVADTPPAEDQSQLTEEQRLARIADLDKQLAAVRTEDEVQTVKASLRESMSDETSPWSSRIAAGARLLVADMTTAIYDFENRRLQVVGYATDSFVGDQINRAGGFVADVVQEAVTGKVPETHGAKLDDKMRALFESESEAIASDDYSGKGTTAGAYSINDVRGSGNNPNDYSRGKVSEPGEDAGRAMVRAPYPESSEAAEKMVQSVSNSKKPSIPDLYNAFSLAKVGRITNEQLFNYARTGKLDAQTGSADWQIFDRGATGGLVAVDRNDPRNMAQLIAPTASANEPDPAARLRMQEAIAASVDRQAKPEFSFQGRVDDRAYQQFINAYEDIAAAYNIPPDNLSLATPTQINQLAKGARFVQRFDEDDLQFFDFKFGDFSVPFTAGNVALGAMLSGTGITDQDTAAYALRTYLRDVRPVSNLDDANFVERMRVNEMNIQQQYRDAQETGEYILPGNVKKKGRPSLEDLRQEAVNLLIKHKVK